MRFSVGIYGKPREAVLCPFQMKPEYYLSRGGGEKGFEKPKRWEQIVKTRGSAIRKEEYVFLCHLEKVCILVFINEDLKH